MMMIKIGLETLSKVWCRFLSGLTVVRAPVDLLSVAVIFEMGRKFVVCQAQQTVR